MSPIWLHINMEREFSPQQNTNTPQRSAQLSKGEVLIVQKSSTVKLKHNFKAEGA